MIDINDVSFAYGTKTVLNDISLSIPSKSLTALIGLNGAGKSTLLSCLAKQKEISNGQITVNGKSIGSYSYRAYSRLVSVVPQISSLIQFDGKVRDYLVEGRTPYLSAFAVPGKKDYIFSEKNAHKMGIGGLLDLDFAKLSGGEQQLVVLTRALIQDTPIILLDEPMSALDLKNQAFFLKIIKQLSDEGKTVLFSTHNPNHALLLKCDVVMMKDGSITCHDKAVHCLTQINISNVFGDEVHLIENEFGSSAVLKL